MLRELETHLEILDSLKSYFDASLSVSRDEFRIVTRTAVVKHPSIQALEWIPRISHAQREVFERTQLDGRPIRRRDVNGVLQAAEIRPEYYAIQFIEPPDNNAPAFGYDVTNNPIAAAALMRARDTGQITAAAPLRLVQETADALGIALYKPVYQTPHTPIDLQQRRESITGVVALIFRIQDLIESEMPTSIKGMIAMHLINLSKDGPPGVLYRSHDDEIQNLLHTLVEKHPINLAGQHWMLEYSATPEFVAENTNWAVWVVLTGGLLITALLGTGLLMLTGSTLRMEDEVNERTAELSEEVNQRRDAETQLRLVLDGANLGFCDWNYQSGQQWVNDRWMEILGLQLGDLKHHVNDWFDRIGCQYCHG